ncbi:MAG: sulfotransferase [Roseovarius sp.]
MIVAALLLGLIAFIAVLRILRAEMVARRVASTAQTALRVMSDPDKTDDEKEREVRRASVRLLGLFFAIAGIGVAALGATVAVVWGGAQAGLYSIDAAIAVASGWPFLLGSSVGAVALWLALDRIGRKTPATEGEEAADRGEVPYGPMEQALHNFAFASPGRQKRLGALETRIYRRRIDPERAHRPVFVTSLPRAGTTILLNAMAGLPEFASATYRHMPFTLSPLLWSRIGPMFQQSAAKAERAHGDGLEVSGESPEAFEEMVWMAFYADHYRQDRILPWDVGDYDQAFAEYFRTHMAKVVATKPGARRYLSKNNANIARLPLIDAICPDATVLIPVRDPRAHVASLMRQHARFLDLHAREPFGRRYMEGVGHFEFGEALRPIAFREGAPGAEAATGPDFWLRYWIDAYEHVLATAGRGVVFLDHDAFCAAPGAQLPLLAEAVGAADPAEVAGLAGMFRAPGPVPVLEGADPQLLARASGLHDSLCRRALGAGSAQFAKEATA